MYRNTGLACLALIAVSGLAATATQPALHSTSIRAEEDEQSAVGTIGEVTLDEYTFVLKVDDENQTFWFDTQTRFTLDGQSSTARDALHIDYDATVTHTDFMASEVDVTTPDDNR